jgi:hypothetical protein
VLLVGETEVVPPATGVMFPTLWSIDPEVTFELVHVRVELLPLWIVVGFAESVHIGTGTVVTVTVAGHVTV